MITLSFFSFGIWKGLHFCFQYERNPKHRNYYCYSERYYIAVLVEMSIRFHIVNRAFLSNLNDFINLNVEAEKDKFSYVTNRVFKATIAHKYLCTITDKDLKVQKCMKIIQIWVWLVQEMEFSQECYRNSFPAGNYMF